MKNIKIIKFNYNKNSNNYVKLFILILCSIVGVGFVSGAEIGEFFVRFGNYYFIGLIVFFIMVYLVLYKILVEVSFTDNIEIKKSELNLNKNNTIILKKDSKNYVTIKNIISFINVLVISGAMFSGLKHLIFKLYNNNYILVYILINLVIFIILFFGVKWLSKIDIVVILFILYIVLNLLQDNTFNFNVTKIKININFFKDKNLFLSIFYSCLYVFMNFFQIKPLIISTKIKFKSKNKCKIFSLIFALLLSSVLIVFILFLRNNIEYMQFKMPFLDYFEMKNAFFYKVFTIGLLLAIISTLVSSLIGVREYLKKIFKLNYFKISLIVFIFCFMLGYIDFNFYVKILYPILGIINLISLFIKCNN